MSKSKIHINPAHRGELHRETGTPAGQKIPESKIQAAKHSGSAAERKRATFAENARHWKH